MAEIEKIRNDFDNILNTIIASALIIGLLTTVIQKQFPDEDEETHKCILEQYLGAYIAKKKK